MPESDPAPGRERPAAARRSTGKATTTKATAKKSAGRRAAAKKSPPKKSAPKKAAAKQTAAKKSAPKKSAAKKSAAKKTPAPRRTGRGALPVRPRESPWTKQDIAAVRGELADDRSRLLDEVTAAEQEIKVLLRDGGDGAGNDQADVGSKALERDAEMSLANNSREMLIQVERALARLDDGTYGVCESCGQPIGKLRLMAFPRATLCLSCKQRQERR